MAKKMTDIEVGDVVKISRNGERFWIIVKKISPGRKRRILGKVDSFVVMQPKLRRGSMIRFKAEDIVDVWVDEDE